MPDDARVVRSVRKAPFVAVHIGESFLLHSPYSFFQLQQTMGKKKRGGGHGQNSSTIPPPRLAVDTSSQQSQPPALPSPSSLPLPQAPLPLPPPPSQALIKLERYVHVANAWCDNTSACFPRSALQAQAQAQPRAASFGVSCAIQGRHPEADARITILALNTRQPSLLLRMSGNAWASLEGGGGVKEGDYMYEWPILPTSGGGSSSSNGGGGRSHSGRGSGRFLSGSGPLNTIACLALSEDLRRLLCVTREGNAYGLHVRRVVKAARRVYDHKQDEATTSNDSTSEMGKESQHWGQSNRIENALEQRKASSSTDNQQQQRFNPLGPSLFDFSLDPKYQRDGPGSLQILPGGSGGLGGGSGGGIGGGSGGGGAQRRAKDISLGSMSAEGDFVPRCCVWWTPAKGITRRGGVMGSPAACSSMAIVGGTSGGRGALSILDMDQEREVDLLYVPFSLVEGSTEETEDGHDVAALQIHTVGGNSNGSSRSDSPLQQRILLITLASGRLYSLVLESSTDPVAPLSPTRHHHHQQQQQQDDPSPSRSGGGSRRHSGSSSSSSTPQNQRMKYPRAATLGLPPPSPMTPPRSSPHSTTTIEASSSSSSTQPISSLLLTPPQRGHKTGKRKGSSGGGGGRERGGGGEGGGSSLKGLKDNYSSRMDEGQKEREAESLWDRCFARLDPYSSSLDLPRQPHIHACFASTDGAFETACSLWRRDNGAAAAGGGDDGGGAAARLPSGWWEDTKVVNAVQSISKEKREEQGGQEAFGLVLSRLSPCGRSLTVEVHYCALAASGGGGGEEGAATATAAAAAAPACRCLCQIALAGDLEAMDKMTGKNSSKTGEMCVSRVIEATLMPEKFLVLSVAACRRRQEGGPAAAWGRDIGENEDGLSSSSFWLLTYRLPQDKNEDDVYSSASVGPPLSPLLRAFQSPTKAPLSFLGWLVPVKPDIRDILNLARSRMFLPSTPTSSSSTTGPDDVLAWSLVVWSRCSIFLLRLLANKEEETMSSSPRPGKRGGFALPEFPLPSSLPSSLQARALAPGEMVTFIKNLGKEGKVNEALTLAWSLLLCDLDDGSNFAPKGLALHPEYFKRLKGADPWLMNGGLGRARVALQCVRWMAGGRAPAGWTKEDLLLFLEACPDYNLGKVVALLLARRCVSEALFASWVREKVPGLSKTLDCLAAMASSASPTTSSSTLSSSTSSASLFMPLSRSDVAWLCGVGAGKCIIQAGHSVLWAVLSLRLKLDILLSDPHLLLLHEQYQWLLATLPSLPHPYLGALVLQLSYWLGLGPLPTREPPPPLPMSPRLVVAATAFQEKEEGGARGVSLISAWSSREGVVAGLAAAVGGLTAKTTAVAVAAAAAATKEWQKELEEIEEDEGNREDQVKAEENERNRREMRMLSDLLLEVLLILAQPLAYTRTVLHAHRLAQQKTISTASGSTFLARPPDLSLPEREALEAQLLLEKLVVAWTSQSAASVTSSSTFSSRNVHFTPAIILMRALTRATTTLKNAGAAALLLEAEGEWEGALQIRLDEVVKITTGCVEDVDVEQARKEEAIEVLLRLLQSHVLVREDTLKWTIRKRMAAKLLESWARLGLSPDRLESVILPSVDDSARNAAGASSWAWHMGVALLTDLLILHAGAPDSLVDADGALVVQGNHPLRFSSSFYVRLTEHVKTHGQAMQQAGVTDLWSTGGRAPALLRIPRPIAVLWDALYKQIQSLEAGQAATNRIEVPLQRLLDATARGRSGSNGRSTSNGYDGDKHDINAPSSRTGARRLLGPGGLADRWAGNDQEEGVSIVAFSCGHILSQIELLERYVPALESKLRALDRPLHLTTEILIQEYRALTGSGCGVGGGGGMGGGSHQGISLACPSCVTAFMLNIVNQQEQ